jgi:hypothetical protein
VEITHFNCKKLLQTHHSVAPLFHPTNCERSELTCRNGLGAPEVFDLRNKRLNHLEFIGSYGPPINGIKYFITHIRFWLKHCNIQRRFIRIMLDPEDFIDFQLKVPAYPFAQAFSAGGFKNPHPGLGGHNSIRSEMLHIRVAYGKIEQSQPP